MDRPILARWKDENARILAWGEALRSAMAGARDADLRGLLAERGIVERHYRTKERLFARLAAKGFDGPDKVMRGRDQRALEALEKAWRELEAGAPRDVLHASIERAAKAVIDMVSREEGVLFPRPVELLTADDWSAISVDA